MTNLREMLQRDTAALAMPNGRMVGTPGHDVARHYLLNRIREIGLVPLVGDDWELPFEAPYPESGIMTKFTNLVGVVPGKDRRKPSLLVGAHYDSVIPGPCADDNATAVAVALAVATQIAAEPLQQDLIVALFDSEEPPYFLTPCMGSIRFFEDCCANRAFQCAIIMDLIGHDVEMGSQFGDSTASPFKDFLFVMGAESHAELPAVVESAAAAVAGLRVLPTLNENVGDMSDHHVFRVNGQPYLFLSCGQGKYYHQPEDNLDWINLNKVARVAEFVLELLREVQGSAIDVRSRHHDTTAFEIRMIQAALGPQLPPLLSVLGLHRLETRADLEQLVFALKGLIGHAQGSH